MNEKKSDGGVLHEAIDGIVSEFMDEYAKAEKEILNKVDNDPILKLKDREIDLKARDQQSKEEQAEDK